MLLFKNKQKGFTLVEISMKKKVKCKTYLSSKK